MNKDLSELLDTLVDIKTKKEMHEFLKGILTEKELEEIPTRLTIVKLLKSGMPQHDIAKKLHIGVATVTRGAKELQKGRFQNV